MKKLLQSLLVLPLVISISLGADNNASEELYPASLQSQHLKSIPSERLPIDPTVESTSKSGNSIQSVIPRAIGWRQQSASASMQNNYVNPFVYEPISKTLHWGVNWRYTPTPGGPVVTLLYDFFSSDMGNRWVTPITNYESPGDIHLLWYSLGVVNPNKIENVDSTNVTSALTFLHQASRYIPPTGGGQFLEYQTGQFNIQIDGETEVIEEARPTLNQPGSVQRWLQSRLISYSNPTTNDYKFGLVSTLSPVEGAQFGYYGYFGFDPISYESVSNSPQQWWVERFRPSEQLNSSFQAPMNIDFDPAGNVYASVINIFIEDLDFANRKPGVSRSTDGGLSWTTFNTFPVSLYEQLATAEGFPQGGIGGTPYVQHGFVVTGENQFSIFFRVGLSNPVLETSKTVLAEAYFENGQWGLRKIADLNTNSIISMSPDVTLSNDLRTVWTVVGNARGAEIQASKTEAGDIVVKWIDNRSTPLLLNETLSYNNAEGGAVETTMDLNATDIFLAYKELGSPWSPAKQVTNDTVYYKSTFTPRLIPSLSQVPLMVAIPQADTNYYNMNLQPIIRQASTNGFFWTLFYSSVNVYDLNNTSVENDNTLDTRLNVIEGLYPNPANGVAEVTYNLGRDGNVKLEIYDVMGKNTKTLFEGFTTSGIHGLTIEVNEIPVGNYYVVLTTDHGTFTKALAITR